MTKLTSNLRPKRLTYHLYKMMGKYDSMYDKQKVNYKEYFKSIELFDVIINHLKSLAIIKYKEGYDYENNVDQRLLNFIELRSDYIMRNEPDLRIHNQKIDSLERLFQIRSSSKVHDKLEANKMENIFNQIKIKNILEN